MLFPFCSPLHCCVEKLNIEEIVRKEPTEVCCFSYCFGGLCVWLFDCSLGFGGVFLFIFFLNFFFFVNLS